MSDIADQTLQFQHDSVPLPSDRLLVVRRFDSKGNPAEAGDYSVSDLITELGHDVAAAKDAAVAAKDRALEAQDASEAARNLAQEYRDDAMSVSSIGTHKTDPMPHQFQVGGSWYKYGFKATSDGTVQFIYEEVV